MTSARTLSTTYVSGEGLASLDACMAATFDHCRYHDVGVIVFYTATGDGPCIALERFCSKPEYSTIRLVAVTPPADKTYIKDPRIAEPELVQTGVTGAKFRQLSEARVPVVSARLPFRSLFASDGDPEKPTFMDPIQLVDRAFGVLGGGFSFCLQVVMAACDAGVIKEQQRVAVMSADTAIVAYACQSESFLSPKRGLLVEHIICRPTLYDVSKRHHLLTLAAIEARKEPTQGELPLDGSEPQLEGGSAVSADDASDDSSTE